MVRKNQIRKYPIQKIMELVSTQTNRQTLSIYTEVISDKNKLLQDKQYTLTQELSSIRTHIQKIVRQMNEGVKDRIQLKTKIIMDKRSRPTNDHVKQLTDLFAYIQDQNSKANRNYNDIEDYLANVQQKDQELTKKTLVQASYSELDQQYQRLYEQSERQLQVRDKLIQERNDKLKHYSCISDSIDVFRHEYEEIESKIAIQERKLVQLMLYYSARTQEDKQTLQHMRSISQSMESELLKAQTIVNQNSDKYQSLSILRLEADTKIHE